MIERDEPRAHVVVDDFFAPEALPAIFKEVQSLGPRMKPGLVRDIGHDGQSVFFEHARRRNEAIWIHDPSKTVRLFREHLWSDALLESFETAREPLFQIIANCSAPHLQVSRYMTGDHYDFHVDEGAGVNLTAIVFLAFDPERVQGGDLAFCHDGQEATVRFRHNRLVIFPSKTLHRVTRVRVDGADTKYARVSLQSWLTYGRAESKPRRRPAQADLPTFLLAEPSILAAAQALSGSSAKDQTPEDLYWGAFYVSRILTSNLRCLVAEEGDLELGRIRIRRGEELEVYARGTFGGTPVRVGFTLCGPPTAPAKSLSLFVEMGRGKTKSISRRLVAAGSDERATGAILRRLLATGFREVSTRR